MDATDAGRQHPTSNHQVLLCVSVGRDWLLALLHTLVQATLLSCLAVLMPQKAIQGPIFVMQPPICIC